MPRQIPLLLGTVFVLYLLRQDAKRAPNVSYALWIPWLWFAIFASRAISSWFGMGVVGDSDYYLEGSPFDRNVFIILIILGIIILLRRKVNWSDVLKKNIFIFIYIFYLLLSTLWSDFTFVSFKRWIKELGHITMVLIVLTEDEPVEALKTMIKRCAYVLLPLSIILNRYYPEISRIYSIGGGDPQFAGVTTNKNSLGALCMVCGIVLFWSFLAAWKTRKETSEYKELSFHLLILIMTSYLLYSAHSATSFLATMIGISIIIILDMHIFRRNVLLIKYCVVAAIISLIIIHYSFDLMSLTTSGLGRDETLTGRTEFWQELMGMETNSWIGTGYESFWLGDRIDYFWDKYWWHPNQAHNGYLEIYLNLGIIGLILLLCFLIFTISNVRKNLSMMKNYDFQVIRIAFLVIFLAINITEANFKGFMWLVFLLFAFESTTGNENLDNHLNEHAEN